MTVERPPNYLSLTPKILRTSLRSHIYCRKDYARQLRRGTSTSTSASAYFVRDPNTRSVQERSRVKTYVGQTIRPRLKSRLFPSGDAAPSLGCCDRLRRRTHVVIADSEYYVLNFNRHTRGCTRAFDHPHSQRPISACIDVRRCPMCV